MSIREENHKASWWRSTALVVAGFVGAYFVNEYVTDSIVRDRAAGTGTAVIIALPFLAYGARRWFGGDSLDWMGSAEFFALLVFLVYGVGYGIIDGRQQWSTGEVAAYCKYGSVSPAQLSECRHNVSRDYVESLHTNAARFARGTLERCLSDSGPFCDEIVQYRDYSDQRDPPPFG